MNNFSELKEVFSERENLYNRVSSARFFQLLKLSERIVESSLSENNYGDFRFVTVRIRGHWITFYGNGFSHAKDKTGRMTMTLQLLWIGLK